MSEMFNPDRRFANMTRTEIESHVKARCSNLISHKHIIPESSGRKIKFYVTEKNIEHLISDAIYRANGVFFISDICELPNYFQTAIFIKTEKEEKRGEYAVRFCYYEICIDNRKLYLNIKEDKKKRRNTLHSITAKIKMPTL